MNFLDRIAVTADYRTAAGGADHATQIDSLVDFIGTSTTTHIDYVTTDPDVGRDMVKDCLEHNFSLVDWLDEVEGTDNLLLDAIKEALDEGHTPEAILQAIYDTVRAAPDDGQDPSYLCWAALGDEDYPLDGRPGVVDGKEVADIYRALVAGLSPANIAHAHRRAGYPLRGEWRPEGDHYVSIDYGDAGWAGYFKPNEFRRALGEVKNAQPLFERPLDRRHGGGSTEPRETEQRSIPVPHAKEQLLRHLLRYAR